ncbi:hypothetical protein GCM10022244_32350 [Streptomyces gulbargensis]|uniref:Uncharacterized protein n=1 Tax=Streptomyces gulbargensis TaxID=364901 RepID=A0ABP7MDX6_9ACTN
MVNDEGIGTADPHRVDTRTAGEHATHRIGTAVLLAAAPAGRGRAMDAASVLPALAAVPPGVLTGTVTATVVELADPLDPQTVLTRLRAAAATPGPLALYLAGQLHLDRRQQLPHLALARTTPATLRYTALPWHWLTAELAVRPAGTTTVVADLAADAGVLERLATDPGLLRLGPGTPLFGRVVPAPRRGEPATPDYLRAWADLWRTGARPSVWTLHAEAAARAPMAGSRLLTPPQPPAGTPYTPPPPPGGAFAPTEREDDLTNPTVRFGAPAAVRRDGGAPGPGLPAPANGTATAGPGPVPVPVGAGRSGNATPVPGDAVPAARSGPPAPPPGRSAGGAEDPVAGTSGRGGTEPGSPVRTGPPAPGAGEAGAGASPAAPPVSAAAGPVPASAVPDAPEASPPVRPTPAAPLPGSPTVPPVPSARPAPALPALPGAARSDRPDAAGETPAAVPSGLATALPAAPGVPPSVPPMTVSPVPASPPLPAVPAPADPAPSEMPPPSAPAGRPVAGGQGPVRPEETPAAPAPDATDGTSHPVPDKESDATSGVVRPAGGVTAGVEDPHPAILAAAMAGRHGEAAAVAAAWESEALRRFGPRSREALHWLEVRADLARLAGEPARSCELWIAVADALLAWDRRHDDPEVEGAVDRAHHQWEQIGDAARARALGPALLALRRRVPGRKPGAVEALRRRMGR